MPADCRALVAIEPRYWFNPDVAQPEFAHPRLGRHHHDADRHAADGAGRGPRVGARHDGGADGHAGRAVAEFLLGKLVPYFLLGMGAMVLSVIGGGRASSACRSAARCWRC